MLRSFEIANHVECLRLVAVASSHSTVSNTGVSAA